MSKKALVTLHLSCRVHLYCHVLGFPSDRWSKSASSSPKILYTNIEQESRFLLTHVNTKLQNVGFLLAPNLHPEAIQEILRLRPCRVFSPMLPGSSRRKWRRPGRLPFRAASWMPPPRVAVPRAACPRSTVKPFQTLRASDPGGSTI